MTIACFIRKDRFTKSGFRFLLLLMLGLFCYLPLNARHIIGGEITYVCLGGGLYDFELRVYRDCASGGAAFDNPASVTIYRELNGVFSIVTDLDVVPAGDPTSISPNANPCLIIPPGICVEEQVYQFASGGLTDPDATYHVIYQRCCRNNTINNIVNPGGSGATYSIEILPEAREGDCNDSPVFNDFPPIVICSGEPLEFDHSATDPDGDVLEYAFCAPNLGGGLAGSDNNGGSPSACNGVAPDPACPPPFGRVTFVGPTYSAANPVGGDPQVQIDRNTGMITGIPDLPGQYVVGVCVSEYRNGVLMGTVRRDFQFNVTSCEPTVRAVIGSSERVGVRDFVITSCGENTISFNNQSVQRSNISEFYWDFEIDGTVQRFTDWTPTISFPDTGTYEGHLVLNPGLNCGDTANIFVNVFPPATADFEFSYDTCVAGPVQFTDLSSSEGGPIVTWNWDFGDGSFSGEQNPAYLFSDPGVQTITLRVTDVNGCQDTKTADITWFPAPPLIIVEPSTFDGCAPQDVFFNNLSTPIDDTYDIVWDLGDGTTSNEISPIHTYEEPGVYSLSLEITSPIGCFISQSWTNWVRVRPSPMAGFIYNPLNPTNFNPEVTFTDQSVDAARWEWDFGGFGSSFIPNPVFSFPDTGQHIIQQVVTHISGCTDTAYAVIDIEPQVRYFIPNAFTPNNDDTNDEFVGAGIFDGIENFQLTIWNRWGELLFETADPNEGWNGRKNNTGTLSPMGVYVYIVEYTGPRGEQVSQKGFVTLVK